MIFFFLPSLYISSLVIHFEDYDLICFNIFIKYPYTNKYTI